MARFFIRLNLEVVLRQIVQNICLIIPFLLQSDLRGLKAEHIANDFHIAMQSLSINSLGNKAFESTLVFVFARNKVFHFFLPKTTLI